MSSGHQRITWRRNIAENFNRLSRVRERYRQTDDRQTDGRRHIANMNMSSRSLKTRPKNLTRVDLNSVPKSTLSGKLFHALTIRSAKKFEGIHITQAEV